MTPVSSTQSQDPPHSNDAETAILGGLLFEDNKLREVKEMLRPEHFYSTRHKLIYTAMLELHDKKTAIDEVTVCDLLTRKKQLEEAGGLPKLAELRGEVATAANIMYYTGIVKRFAVLRNMIKATTDITAKSYRSPENIEEFLAESERNIREVTDAQIDNQTHIWTAAELADCALKDLYRAKSLNDVGKSAGTPTFSPRFNELLPEGGLGRGQIYVVAAWSSDGKSAFIRQSILYQAMHGHPVYLASGEDDHRLAARGFISLMADVRNTAWKGNYSDEEEDKICSATEEFAKLPIYFDDGHLTSKVVKTMTIENTAATAYRLKKAHNITGVYLDWTDHFHTAQRFDSDIAKTKYILKVVKGIAKENSIFSVLVHQFKKREGPKVGRPTNNDLIGSTRLWNDADCIVLLYRPARHGDIAFTKHCIERFDCGYTDQISSDGKLKDKPFIKDNFTHIEITKNRAGPIGRFCMGWNGPTTQFLGDYPG